MYINPGRYSHPLARAFACSARHQIETLHFVPTQSGTRYSRRFTRINPDRDLHPPLCAFGATSKYSALHASRLNQKLATIGASRLTSRELFVAIEILILEILFVICISLKV